MSWSRAFHVPITTPDGLMLRTLRDAGEYMQALARAKLKQPEWEIAAETLLARETRALSATGRGSESRSPSCPIEAAPSASGVACRDRTKSRQDFSGSGIWEGPSGTDGAGGAR